MLKSTRPLDELLLNRYVAGECTLVESRVVEQWVALNPENEKRLALVRLLFQREQQSLLHVDAPAALRTWFEREHVDPSTRLASKSDGSITPVRRPIKSGAWLGSRAMDGYRWTAVTAGVLLVLGLSWTAIRLNHRSAGAGQAAREYATGFAERRTFSLVDGTQVTLAPASRIRILRDYGQDVRELQLEGEAFFSVLHDPKHPFVVRTGQGSVRDVGTSFNLAAYPEDGRATLAVAEGEVAISRIGCSANAHVQNCMVTATQGDVATFGGAEFAIQHLADIQSYLSWTQSQLVFHRAPLTQVAHDLERAFGVQITIADSTTGQQLITGNFDKVPVDQVLDEIAQMLDVRFVRKGRTVVISQRPTRSLTDSSNHSHPPLSTALGMPQ